MDSIQCRSDKGTHPYLGLVSVVSCYNAGVHICSNMERRGCVPITQPPAWLAYAPK